MFVAPEFTLNKETGYSSINRKSKDTQEFLSRIGFRTLYPTGESNPGVPENTLTLDCDISFKSIYETSSLVPINLVTDSQK